MARILVVEDNAINMKLVVLMLHQNNHEVLQATDAEEGIRLAREQMPKLILMDVQLPGMDGLAATRLLKADLITRDIKIVALTALAMPGDRDRVDAAGCDAYLSKPIRYLPLLKIVEQMTGDVQGSVEQI